MLSLIFLMLGYKMRFSMLCSYTAIPHVLLRIDNDIKTSSLSSRDNVAAKWKTLRRSSVSDMNDGLNGDTDGVMDWPDLSQ